MLGALPARTLAPPMPTIKGVPGPYRLLFYSFDCNEPPHVHAWRERATCKFWLDPWRWPRTTASPHGI